MNIVNVIIQILLGLFLAYLIYVISLWIMASDKLILQSRFTQAIKKRTRILNGWINAENFNMRTYATYNPTRSKYLDVSRSVNRKGGAQFTYSFWMNLTDPAYLFEGDDCGDGVDLKSFCLFVKGDKKKYEYSVANTNKIGRVVMCPAVFLGNDMDTAAPAVGTTLVVKFNTITNPFNYIKLEAMPNEDSTIRRNIQSLAPGKWVMYSFVFMDNVPLNDFETGVIVKSYVNDILYQTDVFSGAIRENDGDFNLLPDGPPGRGSKLTLSTMNYFNYALGDIDVIREYQRGISDQRHSETSDDSLNTLTLGPYNKLEMHNL